MDSASREMKLAFLFCPIAESAQVWLTILGMAQYHVRCASKPSQWVSSHNTRNWHTEKSKWNEAAINVISYTCVWQVNTSSLGRAFNSLHHKLNCAMKFALYQEVNILNAPINPAAPFGLKLFVLFWKDLMRVARILPFLLLWLLLSLRLSIYWKAESVDFSWARNEVVLGEWFRNTCSRL